MKFRTLNEGHRPCLIQTEFKNGFRDIKTPLCIFYSDISDAFEVLIDRYNKDIEKKRKWYENQRKWSEKEKKWYEEPIPDEIEFVCKIAFLNEGEGLSFKTAGYTNEYIKIGKEVIKMK